MDTHTITIDPAKIRQRMAACRQELTELRRLWRLAQAAQRAEDARRRAPQGQEVRRAE